MFNLGLWEETVRQAQQPPTRHERERVEFLMQMQHERAAARSARVVAGARRVGGWLRGAGRPRSRDQRPERDSGAAA